jgi:hypothetical protein
MTVPKISGVKFMISHDPTIPVGLSLVVLPFHVGFSGVGLSKIASSVTFPQ